MGYYVHIHVCFACRDNEPVANVAKRHLTAELKEKSNAGGWEAGWFLGDLSERTGINQRGLSLWGVKGDRTVPGKFVEVLRPFWRDLYRENVLWSQEHILVFEEQEQDFRTTAYEIGYDYDTDSLSVEKRKCPFAFTRDAPDE